MFVTTRSDGVSDEYNLIVTWNDETVDYPTLFLAAKKSSSDVRLLRLTDNPLGKTCAFQVCPEKNANITNIVDDLKLVAQGADIEIFEASTNW